MVRAHHLRDKIHIAVIGGNGFIGRNFIASVADQAHLRIWSLDYQHHNIHLQTKGSKAVIEQVLMDVSTPSVTTWLASRPMDVIVYAAGYESPTDGLGETIVDVKALQALVQTVNSYKSMRLVHEDDRLPYFLYLSSWSVYGENNVSISTEDDELVPANYTGMGKMYCEDVVKRIMTKLEVPWCILRPTEVYGKKHHKELRSSTFWPGYFHYYVDKVLKRQSEIEVFSPESKIDLIHVNYLSQVIVDCIVSKRTGVYNVSSGYSMTMRELVERIQEAYGERLSEIVPSNRLVIEDMTIEPGVVGNALPYNHARYSLTKFLDQYLPIRRLEIADDMTIEQIVTEPKLLDSTGTSAMDHYRLRRDKRELDYKEIREIAGPEQFKYIRYGRFQERARELLGYKETEELKDLSSQATSLIELFKTEAAQEIPNTFSPQTEKLKNSIKDASRGRKKRAKTKKGKDDNIT